jgi:hypothetical protein
MMSSMRGGFRSVVTGAASEGKAAASPFKRWFWNGLTLFLLGVVVVVLLRRFGWIG